MRFACCSSNPNHLFIMIRCDVFLHYILWDCGKVHDLDRFQLISTLFDSHDLRFPEYMVSNDTYNYGIISFEIVCGKNKTKKSDRSNNIQIYAWSNSPRVLSFNNKIIRFVWLYGICVLCMCTTVCREIQQITKTEQWTIF